jgi:hypothetical protein
MIQYDSKWQKTYNIILCPTINKHSISQMIFLLFALDAYVMCRFFFDRIFLTQCHFELFRVSFQTQNDSKWDKTMQNDSKSYRSTENCITGSLSGYKITAWRTLYLLVCMKMSPLLWQPLIQFWWFLSVRAWYGTVVLANFLWLPRAYSIWYTLLHRKHANFYIVDFEPLQHFWLVIEWR